MTKTTVQITVTRTGHGATTTQATVEVDTPLGDAEATEAALRLAYRQAHKRAGLETPVPPQ
jgi:hypothetical protein